MALKTASQEFYEIFNKGKIATIITFANIKLEDEPERDGYLEILQDHLLSIKNQRELEAAEEKIFRCSSAKEIIFTIKELDNNPDKKAIREGIQLFVKAGKLHREGKSTEEIQEETGLDKEQVEDIQKLL